MAAQPPSNHKLVQAMASVDELEHESGASEADAWVKKKSSSTNQVTSILPIRHSGEWSVSSF